jgi:hypothetical protein
LLLRLSGFGEETVLTRRRVQTDHSERGRYAHVVNMYRSRLLRTPHSVCYSKYRDTSTRQKRSQEPIDAAHMVSTKNSSYSRAVHVFDPGRSRE